MSGNQSSDDSAGPALPRGVLKARSGWKGDDLELQHQREVMNRDDGPSESAAVNLNQFRNEEVGEGYQAKHVIRQRSGQHSEIKIRDMSRANENEKDKKKSKKRKKHSSTDAAPETKEDPKERVRKYLQCDGLLQFRRELEKIN
jgi:LPS O-antigen subunit length determinant protein (WzzB/FepE family)